MDLLGWNVGKLYFSFIINKLNMCGEHALLLFHVVPIRYALILV